MRSARCPAALAAVIAALCLLAPGAVAVTSGATGWRISYQASGPGTSIVDYLAAAGSA
jgi:hypothetical protein